MTIRPRPRPPIDDTADDEAFYDDIADAIDRSPKVRAALLRLIATSRAGRQPRPTTVPPRRTGRGS
jgi:hypothetical protein